MITISVLRRVAFRSGLPLLVALHANGSDASAQVTPTARDLDELRQELQDHVERVALLERMIRDIEGCQLRTIDVPTPSDPTLGWNELALGMSGTAVVSILGRPTSIAERLNRRVLFYDSAVEGVLIRGSVTIDEHDARVLSIDWPLEIPGTSCSER